MKNVASKSLLIVALLWAQLVFAQDIQELYDNAKQALLNGDYQTALNQISEAKAQIRQDPNLDPNGAFMNRLLPKVESAANTVGSVTKALQELYSSSLSELVFPDLEPSAEAVNQYTQQAKKASEQLMTQRDSILTSYELDPEFRDALRNTRAFKQIEQLASVGIVEKLSEKFVTIASVLTDSIKSINSRYKTVAANLVKMKKAATANTAERQKLEKQLAAMSEERLNYMNAISEMLTGETTANETQPTRMTLMDRNLDSNFTNMINTEINRVQALTEVDSAGYKELVKEYERIKMYNQIFVKNKVSSDQSVLLAQYEAAIKNVKVKQPASYRWVLYLVIIIIVVVVLVIIYRTVASAKKVKATEKPTAEKDKPIQDKQP